MPLATSPKRDRAVNNAPHHDNTNNFHHLQHFRKKHIQEKALSSHSHLPNQTHIPNCKSTSKQHRPPKMKFEVPDDMSDSDSCVSEQDGMDIEGDSFLEQTDGLARVQNDPQWQAQQTATAMLAEVHQHQQEAQQTLEAQQANFERIQNQKEQYDFSPPKPLSARKSLSPIFNNHDQHMLYNDTPSSIGKRKRSESQPPARDTYHSDPDTDTHHLRRIGGMIVTLYTMTTSLLAAAWTYFSSWYKSTAAQAAQEQATQELIAVETDHSGRKRRAVSHDTISPTLQANECPTPSPHDSLSPAVEQETQRKIPKMDSSPMPNLHEYTDSIEPTLADLKALGYRCNTWDDVEAIREEKKALRKMRDDEELTAWERRQDARKLDEVMQFWEKEEQSEETYRAAANCAAVKTKFGENADNGELERTAHLHSVFHGDGRCEDNTAYYKVHEFETLSSHNYAKIVEAEVARETAEHNKKPLTEDEQRAFKKTSANKKFGMKKAQPKSVAAATKEDSRPTTSSSQHKQASYKGGMEPTPKKNAPGTNPYNGWSWDKTMPAGKSLLKKSNFKKTPIKPKSNDNLRDSQVDGLIDRSRKCRIESPQASHIKDFMENCRKGRKEQFDALKEDIRFRRSLTWQAKAEAKIQTEKQMAEQAVEDARLAWDKFALEEKQAEKDAELAWKKVIEDEAARKAAEEAAKLKAEKDEVEAARQAEEDAELAAAEEESRLEAEATHKKKQILIRPLDPEWEERVRKAMEVKDRDTVITQSLDGSDLRRHDFGSLLPQEGSSDDSSGWLNDGIVNAILMAVCVRKQEQEGYKKGVNNVPPYEMYNSGWYTTYRKNNNRMSSLERWSKRKGISGERLLKAKKIFLPINTGAHWQLLIVSPQEKKIEFLDSLRRAGGQEFFRIARDWLKMELGEKLYKAAEWTEGAARSNMQGNTDDCGVFVAMNGLAAGKGYPFEDVSGAKMKEARKMVAAILLNGGVTGDWEL